MIVLGKITNLQGNKGELRLKPYAGAKSLLAPGENIYIEKEKRLFRFQVESVKKIKNEFVVKLGGINSAEEGLFLLGKEVLFPEEKLPSLAEGEFYEYQLIGASVMTCDQEEVGRVAGFWEMRGKTLMVVEKDKKEILIPFEEAICISIDIKKRLIIIDPPEGLLDLNEI